MTEYSHAEENKRLAKNTLTLFVRTFFVMLVGLYVSRVLLQVLGVDDFGIYNVVGGIVVLFSFLNTAMASSSQRYITYTLGTGNIEDTRNVFSASLFSQITIAVLLFIVAEIFGIWLINTKLQIPETRIFAANVTFQFTIFTFCTNVIRIPFEASVVAYEKMSFYALISVVDIVLKLLIVFFLIKTNYDKLITYGVLLFLSSLIQLGIYVFFCRNRFETCRFRIVKERKLYKKLFSFTGWSLFGSGTNVLTQQGFVFILNMFFGVVVNAAMGIANQVNSAMTTFINSFQISYRPQIVKSYAQGDYNHLNKLVHTTSKISFVLIILPVLILIFNMPLILKIWLGNVPEYTIQFCQLILICTTIDAISGSYNAAIMATGKIRGYQLAISLSFIIDLFFSFLLIKLGIKPYLVLLSRVATRGIFNLVIGVYYLRKLLEFKVLEYFNEVVAKIVTMLLAILPLLFVFYSHFSSWKMLLLSSLYVLLVGSCLILFIILNKEERLYLCNFVKRFLRLT